MRWRRRVPLALKVPADRNEAYIGRAVALDLNVAVDVAKVGFAGSRIVDAREIAADPDTGADKAALLRALHDLNIAVHCHPAFEKREGAVSGLEVAADRRRPLRRVGGEARVLQGSQRRGYAHDAQG